MTEFWKSQGKHYCKVCKHWLGSSHQRSIDMHEKSKWHKQNVRDAERDMWAKKRGDARNEKEMAAELKRMEDAAKQAMGMD